MDVEMLLYIKSASAYLNSHLPFILYNICLHNFVAFVYIEWVVPVKIWYKNVILRFLKY